MTVDLDELEHTVRTMNQGVGPSTALALIARIRDLETACRCGAVALRMHHPSSPTANDLDEAARRGVVIP